MVGNPEFGRRIRARREEKRLKDPTFSLRQFAKAVGISPTFLSKVETGEFAPPAPDKIKKMAELLNEDSDELLALAGRVDPDLTDIIREKPKAMADLLRRAQSMSKGQIDKLGRQAEKKS